MNIAIKTLSALEVCWELASVSVHVERPPFHNTMATFTPTVATFIWWTDRAEVTTATSCRGHSCRCDICAVPSELSVVFVCFCLCANSKPNIFTWHRDDMTHVQRVQFSTCQTSAVRWWSFSTRSADGHSKVCSRCGPNVLLSNLTLGARELTRRRRRLRGEVCI